MQTKLFLKFKLKCQHLYLVSFMLILALFLDVSVQATCGIFDPLAHWLAAEINNGQEDSKIIAHVFVSSAPLPELVFILFFSSQQTFS